MQPFNIHCETCAAKLKVKNASAIGQRLACPKCGNMISVVAPDDWELSQEVDLTEASPVDSADLGFDDIDKILEQNQQHKPKQQTPQRKPTRKPEQSPVANQADSNLQPNSSEPLLPNENWTAQASRSRRKQLILGIGIISVLLACTALVLALAANRKNNAADETVSKMDVVANQELKPTDKDDEKANEQLKQPAIADELTDPVEKTDDGNEAIHPSNPDAGADDEKAEVEKEQMIVDNPSTITTPSESSPEESGNSKDSEAPAKKQSPFGKGFDDILNPNLDNIENVESNFESFADALESSGTSLLEINQLASINSVRRRIGLPKYFIQKPDVNQDRKFDGLNFPFKGVQFENLPLTAILADLSQTVGVPVSFDSENLKSLDFDYGLNIEKIKLDNINFQNIVRHLLASVNENLVLDIEGKENLLATISVADRLKPIRLTIDLPTLKGRTPDEFKELVMQMIAPDTWANESNGVEMQINGDQLDVRQIPAINNRISQFIAKWNLALSTKGQAAGSDTFESVWQKSADARKAGLKLSSRIDQHIMSFFSSVQQQTGVQVIVDFNSLYPDGWTQSTLIPFDVEEPTVGELLEEIAHSMNVSYRAINSDTFEILSKEAADDRIELEFYSCSQILDGPINSDQLVQIVRQAIQSSGRRSDNVRVFFADDLASLIVVAPQPIQRLIESLLKHVSKL